MQVAAFYLGAHMPHWLGLAGVPLFVSHRRLAKRRGLPRAACRWALDSGGFTELSMFGEWRTTPAAYVAACRRYRDEIGLLDWCAPQDSMCEPAMLARTRCTVADHQRATVDNYLRLRDLAPDVPYIPVLQGWTLADYHRCVDLYLAAGVDLAACPRVGLGSVCRRQNTGEVAQIVAALDGLRLHGFGVKADGLRRYGWALTSADSMAWSYSGRVIRPCPHGRASCGNCLAWAHEWRTHVIADVAPRPIQTAMAL